MPNFGNLHLVQESVRSGKTDPVQFKGSLKQGPFDCKSGSFASSLSPVGYRTFMREKCLKEKANLSFKRPSADTPKISALLRRRPVLLRANFVLTKDRKGPYYGLFCGKIRRQGSCSKATGGP